jgi:hypothetical protein
MATFRCRTTTPFGRPVVPEVYMMSAMSSASSGTWTFSRAPDPNDDHGVQPGGTSPAVVMATRREGSSERILFSPAMLASPANAAVVSA